VEFGLPVAMVIGCRLTVDHKKSLSSDNLAAAAAAAADADDAGRRLPASPWRDMENDEYAPFVAAVEEMRVSPVISRRGYLYFLEENATGWTKMWVVSTGASLFTIAEYRRTIRKT